MGTGPAAVSAVLLPDPALEAKLGEEVFRCRVVNTFDYIFCLYSLQKMNR